MLARELEIEEILGTAPLPVPLELSPLPPGCQRLGASRGGRPLWGYRFGTGPIHLSLIAGCHADEPVGPAMLDHLTGWLATQADDAPVKVRASWFLVPHSNPDGEAANAEWTRATVPATDHRGEPDRGYDLEAYRAGVVRELPGDDMEFGFPRLKPGLPLATSDPEARPENQAIAAFLKQGAPFSLHGSFHGMAFANGPWFLLDAAWVERTKALRDRLRARVAAMGLRVHDIDRQGEKGFHRIDLGFTTRPDSRAMAQHFRRLGDPATAALFRPSSMETVRSFGGDPLTLVSEMPLFLEGTAEETPIPMALRDQMRLQLAYLQEALAAVEADAEGERDSLG